MFERLADAVALAPHAATLHGARAALLRLGRAWLATQAPEGAPSAEAEVRLALARGQAQTALLALGETGFSPAKVGPRAWAKAWRQAVADDAEALLGEHLHGDGLRGRVHLRYADLLRDDYQARANELQVACRAALELAATDGRPGDVAARVQAERNRALVAEHPAGVTIERQAGGDGWINQVACVGPFKAFAAHAPGTRAVADRRGVR